jgi:Flp pilus assembly protein CpaB
MPYRVRNIVIAVGLAVLAAVLTTFYVANYKRTVQQGETNVPVVVAAQDIPAGTSGTDAFARGLFETREIPRRSVVPGAVASPGDLEGKIATNPIYAGEQVTALRFRPAEEGGIRAQIAGNMRAVQISGDANQTLAGTLREGDRIDLLASLKYAVKDIAPEAATVADKDRIASRVVLRDLLVLRSSDTSPADSVGPAATTGHAVQLAVTDSQAQKLFFVVRNGDWTLQLRPVTGAEDSPESVETLESVLGDGLGEAQFLQLYGGRRSGR